MSSLESSRNDVDFDEWMELYKTDPQQFEKKRVELIQSEINNAPLGMRRRLNGLQWRIDAEIKLADNPLDGCIKVYQMMIDSVYAEGGLRDVLTSFEKDVEVTDPGLHLIK